MQYLFLCHRGQSPNSYGFLTSKDRGRTSFINFRTWKWLTDLASNQSPSSKVLFCHLDSVHCSVHFVYFGDLLMVQKCHCRGSRGVVFQAWGVFCYIDICNCCFSEKSPFRQFSSVVRHRMFLLLWLLPLLCARHSNNFLLPGSYWQKAGHVPAPGRSSN